MSNAGTKYTLSAPMTAGIDNISRLGLNTEAKVDLSRDAVEDFHDVIISGHAPNGPNGEMRWNVAAIDDEFRKESIAFFIGYVASAKHLPHLKKVNMHCAPRRWFHEDQTRGEVGEYDRLIDGIRQIAAFAQQQDIEIVLENDVLKWTDIPDEVTADQVDWESRNHIFGVSPEEWIQICVDVDRPNVGLCLDGSHLSTYVQLFDEPERRQEAIMAYLAMPDLIRHVHWNDNYVFDVRGRKGTHVLIGKGSLPVEFHRRVKGLDATILLEHFETIEDLEEELEFIARL